MIFCELIEMRATSMAILVITICFFQQNREDDCFESGYWSRKSLSIDIKLYHAVGTPKSTIYHPSDCPLSWYPAETKQRFLDNTAKNYHEIVILLRLDLIEYYCVMWVGCGDFWRLEYADILWYIMYCIMCWLLCILRVALSRAGWGREAIPNPASAHAPSRKNIMQSTHNIS